MKDEFVINIKIADVVPIPIRINRDEEARERAIEYNINRLWTTWRAKYRDKSSEEVLAMVTYQFAKKFFMLAEQEQRVDDMLRGFEAKLDELTVNID